MKRVKRRKPVKQRKGKRPAVGNTGSGDVGRLLKAGVAYHQKGDLKKAEPLYRQILDADPNHPQALHLIGVIAHQVGNNKVAQSYIAKAIALKPDYAEAHNNLGNALRDLGGLDEAAASYRKALELKPRYIGAHNNLGIVLRELGRLEESAGSYQKALALKPDYAEAHNNLGNVLWELGRLDEAAASCREALALKPGYAEAHNNLGNVLKGLGQLNEAAARYREAIALNPDHAEAHGNLGNVLKDLGRLDEAAASCRKALALKPDYAEGHNNLGNVLKSLGRSDEAAASYTKAIALKPNLAEAHNNLGNVLKDLERLDEAAASCRKSLALRPGNAHAHSNLGNVLRELGRLGEAAENYREAVALKPEYAEARSNLIYALRLMAGTSSSEIKAEADSFGAMVRSKADPFTDWKVAHDPEKRLRVGLVSGDFRTHVAARYLESFLGAIDPLRTEFFAYSNSVKEDEVTARLKPHFARWRKVVGLDDARLAKLIRDDAVDIVIDLSGHTAFNRLPMFAFRPAPVQATWLGLFATSGVPGMDYIIADPYLAPGDEAQYFTEEIWPLAGSWFCLEPPNVPIVPGPLPALAAETITFGCFNNVAKMTDRVVALWARVMDAVPGSRLFLKTFQLHDGSVRQDSLDRFGVHGISPERLVLEGSSPREAYYAAYQRVDVALDPFPFHGATTSLDGLWMGVPVLTLSGDRVGTHLGESIAHAAGLSDWIAHGEDDYVAKAVALTSDPDSLAELRGGLREQVLASSLYDGARFAGHFEEALRGMWRRACEGQL